MSDEQTLEDAIQWVVANNVGTITINRPDVHNALTPPQRNRIIDLLDEAAARLDVRAVILTAAGDRAFCTGADLRYRHEAPPRPEGAPERTAGEVAYIIRTGAQRLFTAIMDCDKPVIAAVNGTAAGIGAHIAFAADLVIAADTASFIEVFVRRGIVADGGGAYLLPRLIGPQKTKELMFFGDKVKAAEALELGLVNRVVPSDDLQAEAAAWAARLAGQPTQAIRMMKWMVNRSLDGDRSSSLGDEAMAQDIIMTTADAVEGVDAFKERRDPDYKGW